MYDLSFRARTGAPGDDNWKENEVDTSGHPVWVELTLKYREKPPYHFKLVTVGATSKLGLA